MKKWYAGGAAAILMVTASSATAADGLDDAGEGRIPTGAVKNLLGWSNAELDAGAESLHLVYRTDAVRTKSYECTDPESGAVSDWWAAQYTTTVGVLDHDVLTTKKGKVRGILANGFEREPIVFIEEDRYGGDINEPLPTECADGWELTSSVDETTTTSQLAVNGRVLGTDPVQTVGVTDYASTILSSLGWDYRDVLVTESADGRLVVDTGGAISPRLQAEFLEDYGWVQPGVDVVFTNPAT